MRGKDHIHIIYLKKKDIQKKQRSSENPRHFEDNLLVLLGTLQMQWQRHLCLCCQMTQVVSKTTTQKLNIGVNFIYVCNHEIVGLYFI